ncbi:MAG: aspartate--tRNA ligase [Bacteroidetes bacterium]|nr:aspartate--tRNA ligase [Bacteroidota bacterium]
MYRSTNCGSLRIENVSQEVTLAGWIQKVRDLGSMAFIDLRDRYGITQLSINDTCAEEVRNMVSKLGREYVISITGKVVERSSKNKKIATGEVEVVVEKLTILSVSEVPPFTIEDETDGGEELRAKYRYLDLRRNPIKNAMILRHKMAKEVRNYLDSKGFLEIETPILIKSTPEGARDFVVPSRMNGGEFYALPQSPQTFKQLLMVAGFDKYFQIVKCFRDEDLRADRQPEFTQIDCEMSFVEREDVISTFEGMAKAMFQNVLGKSLGEAEFPRMTWADAMENYGSDKPDIRFDMKINNITDLAKGHDFGVFDDAEYIGAICAKGASVYTRKQLDALTDFVKKPQIGSKGLAYARVKDDGSVKSSFDKFFSPEALKAISDKVGGEATDLILILSGDKKQVLHALCELRLEMGEKLGLRKNGVFAPMWVVDFPLLEWNEEQERYTAMHHPFTSPLQEDMELLTTDPGKVRADAYDFVINGVEIGGGSIRIHDRELQQKMFKALGFTPEEAENQFGFLLNAFKYGAPPHGGLAFGFDRWCSMFGGTESIRDYIAFPKNNSGRDVMIDSPSPIFDEQLKELSLQIKKTL